jgi:hypothetical protein
VPNAFEVIYHGALCYGTDVRLSTLRVYISFHTSHVNVDFYFGATLPTKTVYLKVKESGCVTLRLEAGKIYKDRRFKGSLGQHLNRLDCRG